MNWLVFGLSGYVLLALQLGVSPQLGFEMVLSGKPAQVEPQLPLVLGAFVGLLAPRSAALAAWAVLGLMMDLSTVYSTTQGAGLVMVGPYTLGYLAGGYIILLVRSMVFRQHPLTMATMIVASGLAVNLVVVFLLSVRSVHLPDAWYAPLAGFSGFSQTAGRFLSIVYTAVIGLVLAWPMMAMAGRFGLPVGKGGGNWSSRR